MRVGLTTLVVRPQDPADAVAAMWADVRRPEQWPFERLFYQCYARAAQGEETFVRMLPGAVDGWLGRVDELTRGTADPAAVRLALAVTRGLLLDLATTGDADGVDAAAAHYINLLRRHSPSAITLMRSRSPAI